ncbi:LOW QUALITY PROTEIN: Hypothetical protein PHPALM_13760, partial [Phytophthora palmivora]
RQSGGQLCVRVDFSLLDNSTTNGTRIDIATLKCLHFTFSAQQPLRVLFSVSIMQKYSRLGVFLIQVKAVESALVKVQNSNMLHSSYTTSSINLCIADVVQVYPSASSELFFVNSLVRTIGLTLVFFSIEEDMRQLLIQIADMLHYTKSLLSYLTSQIANEEWFKSQHILQSSRSLAEMDAIHEQYLDHLLSRFFLLDKHATVIQYILTTFNHILRFVGQVDEFVSAAET